RFEAHERLDRLEQPRPFVAAEIAEAYNRGHDPLKDTTERTEATEAPRNPLFRLFPLCPCPCPGFRATAGAATVSRRASTASTRAPGARAATDGDCSGAHDSGNNRSRADRSDA